MASDTGSSSQTPPLHAISERYQIHQHQSTVSDGTSLSALPRGVGGRGPGGERSGRGVPWPPPVRGGTRRGGAAGRGRGGVPPGAVWARGSSAYSLVGEAGQIP